MRRFERHEIERFRLPHFDSGRAEKLGAYLLRRRKTDPGLQRSNRGGWQSSPDLHAAPPLASVCEDLLVVASAATGVENIKIVAAWGNVNDEGDWVRPHLHMGWRVAVLMVQPVKNPTIEDEGALMILTEPGIMKPVLPSPQTGEVAMFSGNTIHMVAPHRQSSPRITVAFNLERVG